jgi:hypothetical protein
MLMGKLAMFFGCGGVLLRLFVFAELVMMGRLMMMMCGGVVVSGGSVVMLARWMLRGLGHLLVLLPESGKPGIHKPL